MIIVPRKLSAFLIAFFLLSIPPSFFSQTFLIDSLKIALKKYAGGANPTTLKDTNRVIILNRLSEEYNNTRDFSTAMKYARIAQNISEKLVKMKPGERTKNQLANSYKTVAHCYFLRDDFNNALKQYKNELELRKQLSDKKALGNCLSQVGVMYNYLDDLGQSLEYFFRSLKVIEETGDEEEMAVVYNNLGIAYNRQKNNTKAIEYYKKELAIGEKLKDKGLIANSHTNMGAVYAELGKYEEALKEFNFFLQSAIDEGNKYNIGVGYLNLGDMYARKGEYKNALETNSKALALFEELGSNFEASLAYYNQGYAFLMLAKNTATERKNNLARARINLEKALAQFEKKNQVDYMSYCYGALSSLDSCLGNQKGALEYYKKHILYRDSLVNQENTSKSVRAEMNYEFEKKETSANIEQGKREALARQENDKQKAIRNWFIVAFAFMLLLALFIFRNYHQKRKVNRMISAQKKEVEDQKWIVEEKQKQIIDSINYARRIQTSMLPNQSILKKVFPCSFVYYKPKDIVSGDFYWFQALPATSEILIVLADCTGHGVPGAFLSMVGTTLLNEIVCHKNIHDPAEIIRALNTGLVSTLSSKKEETHSDGMDLSICKINTQKNELAFAGANQTLYVLENGKLEKIESQVISIDGVFDLTGYHSISSFTKKLEKGTSVFMSTDGFADQTGQATGKKFMSSRFEDLLVELHNVTSSEQMNFLDKKFNDWKGNQKQIDDILVIGFKV
jgi:serine phosphatase RsbU (regulator of sigma subunit)/tetratricopeptide (TPR) repeat protein